eukprot:8694341-Ditylum_brightwellii.AAC.2
MSKRVGGEKGREREQDVMSSVTSTTSQVKSTCFNETALSSTTSSHKRLPPKALAINFIKAKTGSLHPSITATLQKLGAHHIDLCMKAYYKATQKKWMVDDDNFIPHSAQIEFTLMASKEAEGEQEYQDLLNETNTIIGDCRMSLKAQVLKCIGIKYKLLKQQIIDDFATSLCFITKQHLVLMQDTLNIDEKISALL